MVSGARTAIRTKLSSSYLKSFHIVAVIMEFIIKTWTYRSLLLPLGATRRGEAGEAKAGAFAYAGGIWERCLYRDPRLGQVRLLRIQLNSSKQRGVEKPGGQEFRSSGVQESGRQTPAVARNIRYVALIDSQRPNSSLPAEAPPELLQLLNS